ncbi:unnamed protein product [Mytilus edulis]|uniref:Uncharacterized protein n=1 Tax=Mytilus edulis TaxID=6550 RepID=A0A8S3T857_MYTED|nr:unnamed protein product [Mytilus edulis]
MGGYYIPPSLRSRPGINQILKYYQYHRETENEYKSYLEKEVAFKSKYQAEFSKFIREYKPEKPLNQSHVRTDLYRALHERQSSSNYVEAVYEFYFLFRLSEEYDLLEMQHKNQNQVLKEQITYLREGYLELSDDIKHFFRGALVVLFIKWCEFRLCVTWVLQKSRNFANRRITKSND